MRNKFTIFVGILVLAIAGGIQFVPVQYENPPGRKEPPWDGARTRSLAARACFDCHSNETRWPWYSRIAPVSWVIAKHVASGREKLNFSEWPAGDLAEAAEEVNSGRMPPSDYLLLHPEAHLTADEKGALVSGLTATDDNLFNAATETEPPRS